MNFKKVIIAILPLTMLVASCGGEKKKNETSVVNLKSSRDSASYAAGLSEGERMLTMMEQSGADTILDRELFLSGFNDLFKNNAKLKKDVCQKVLMTFFGRLQQEQLNKFKNENGGKKEEHDKFLAENKTKKGIITTVSGLQYEVLKKGKGPVIKMGDVVKVHYTGKLLDGSLVDSSRDMEPYEFELQPTGLIQGWIEALQLMNKGAQFQLYIPFELGYGEMGKAPKVPPYAVLVFELEVVDHQPK
jgi:FKBP-type peptidyl-prolyl cis-trans isomerase FklB